MFEYIYVITDHLLNNGFCDLQGQLTSDVRACIGDNDPDCDRY